MMRTSANRFYDPAGNLVADWVPGGLGIDELMEPVAGRAGSAVQLPPRFLTGKHKLLCRYPSLTFHKAKSRRGTPTTRTSALPAPGMPGTPDGFQSGAGVMDTPFWFQAGAAGEAAGTYVAATGINRALAYAASRPNYLGGQGLIYMLKSRTYQGMLNGAVRSGLLTGLLVTADVSMGQALWTEIGAARAGGCQ